MTKFRNISIRLIKKETKYDKIFKSDLNLASEAIATGLPFKGEIHYKKSKTKPPAWVDFLNSGSKRPLTSLYSASASALLLISTSKARFAISFGHAWQWLDEDAIERRFGLLAALNCLDDEIKLVDAQQIDSLALSRRSQASHSSEFVAFGLDIGRDLMKAIVGKPKSPDIGTSIMGADALRITAKMDFHDIGAKCDQLLQLSQKEKYKDNYSWIDNIEAVKSPEEKKELDNILLEAINSGDTESIFLAPPTVRDPNADDEYRFHFDKDPDIRRIDIEFSDILENTTLPIELDFLKKNYIEVFLSGSAHASSRFSIYSGIIFEAKRGKKLSCLIDKVWYNVSNSHVAQINKRLLQISKSTIVLPNAKNGEKEAEYNERACNLLSALCLDKKLITYGGGNSKIEICDILTKNAAFIHVKKADSSQLLSHLFNQGVVSGQFLLEDEFRQQCIKKIDDDDYSVFFASPFSPEKATIVFAIISKKAKNLPDSLPFFSKQTLVNASELLRKFAFKVEINGITIS